MCLVLIVVLELLLVSFLLEVYRELDLMLLVLVAVLALVLELLLVSFLLEVYRELDLMLLVLVVVLVLLLQHMSLPHQNPLLSTKTFSLAVWFLPEVYHVMCLSGI